jgi:hypothetical protein
MMHTLVYVSTAVRTFTPEELKTLLIQCRRDNTAQDITGMLLYKDGNIMQLLEGDKERVTTLYHKIERDPRHRGSLILLQSDTDQRSFKDWSMGFRDLDDPALKQLPGFNALMNDSADNPAFFRDPTRVQKLLNYFKQSMR